MPASTPSQPIRGRHSTTPASTTARTWRTGGRGSGGRGTPPRRGRPCHRAPRLAVAALSPVDSQQHGGVGPGVLYPTVAPVATDERHFDVRHLGRSSFAPHLPHALGYGRKTGRIEAG